MYEILDIDKRERVFPLLTLTSLVNLELGKVKDALISV
jgi:hypothetical protein